MIKSEFTMNKRIISTILIVCMLLTTPFGDPATQIQNCKIIINDATVQLDNPARLIDDVAMLPMREFFEKLDTTVNWYEQTQTITAYKYNMQIKLRIGDTVAYRNGKSFILSHAPIIIDGKTYIPAKFTAESFDMNYNCSDGMLELNQRDTRKKYYIDFIEYASTTIAEYDMTIIIPYGWVELTDNRYGIDDNFDDYSIAVRRYDKNSSESSAQYLEIYKQKLLTDNPSKVTFTYQKTLYTDDLTFESFGYFYNGINAKRIVDIYLLEHNDYYYLFECNSNANSDIRYVRQITYNILDKLQFNNETIETSDEHYYEYPAAFAVNLALNAPITSNMEVFNYLPFNGQIDQKNDYTNLYAIVSKGNEQIDYKIDIDKAGKFNAKIFTPFGLAKHNIAIFGHRRRNKDDLLLRFSALNLSSDEIKYLIPSEYVQSNATEALSLASYLTYNSTSAYFKAKDIFDYVVEDITLENLTLRSLESLRNSTTVITKQRANPLELCITMCALLRASDISARIMSGKVEGRTFYFVEANVNGKWHVYDPVSHILLQHNPSLVEKNREIATPLNRFVTFYHIRSKAYFSILDSYQVLNY